ncbi:hypothetical protein DFP72DRAFT_1046438 [Ephemerocybe angulata]|uniref:Uncharacterized protein n=1 Tax=Ephemerocybe angulata TaxID=980116 RepID=A0A8H6M680_9AGAR|nr:hypothetical protein DFP72DRAFT_1046438 [Tulosesus angulatus]
MTLGDEGRRVGLVWIANWRSVQLPTGVRRRWWASRKGRVGACWACVGELKTFLENRAKDEHQREEGCRITASTHKNRDMNGWYAREGEGRRWVVRGREGGQTASRHMVGGQHNGRMETLSPHFQLIYMVYVTINSHSLVCFGCVDYRMSARPTMLNVSDADRGNGAILAYEFAWARAKEKLCPRKALAHIAPSTLPNSPELQTQKLHLSSKPPSFPTSCSPPSLRLARRTSIHCVDAIWFLHTQHLRRGTSSYSEDDIASARAQLPQARCEVTFKFSQPARFSSTMARGTSIRRLGAFSDIDLPLDDFQHTPHMPPHRSRDAVLSSRGEIRLTPLAIWGDFGHAGMLPRSQSLSTLCRCTEPTHNFEFATGVGVHASSLPPAPATGCLRVAVDVNVNSADVSCVFRDA